MLYVLLVCLTSQVEPNGECAPLLDEARSRPPVQVQRGEAHRVAVLLRGDSFRDAEHQRNEQTCCEGSFLAQKELATYHNHILFPELEADGARVDVYIGTYHCTNGRRDAVPLLASLYGRRLQMLSVTDRSRSNQWATTARLVDVAAAVERAMDVEYDYVLVLRLDTAYGSLRCAAKQRRPMDMQGAGGYNQDKLQLLPRGYFQFCARLIRPCHAPPASDLSLFTAARNITDWQLAYHYLKRPKDKFSAAEVARIKGEYRAGVAVPGCEYAQAEGVNELLKRCGQPPDASTVEPPLRGNESGRIARVHDCTRSRTEATNRVGEHFRGHRAFAIPGGVGVFMLEENRITGEQYDPTQCGCDASLALPSDGPPDLETLLQGIRRWQDLTTEHLRREGAPANATCTVEFDGNRIISHVNASSGGYRISESRDGKRSRHGH